MSMTVTAVAQQMAFPPRVIVDVVSSPAVMAPVTVYRVHADGSQWPVLTPAPLVMTSGLTVVDPLAPFNVPVSYRAETDTQVSPLSLPVTVVSERTWLLHRSNPELSVMAEVELKVDGFDFGSSSVEMQVLDGPAVHRRFGNRPGQRSTMSVLSQSAEQDEKLWRLLADGGQIVINHRLPRQPFFGWRWVQPDPKVSPTLEWVRDDLPMTWSIAYVPDAGPDTDTEPTWTQADVAAQFTTQEQIGAAFANQRALQLDQRS